MGYGLWNGMPIKDITVLSNATSQRYIVPPVTLAKVMSLGAHVQYFKLHTPMYNL